MPVFSEGKHRDEQQHIMGNFKRVQARCDSKGKRIQFLQENLKSHMVER